MKISTKQLAAELQWACRFIDAKTTTPILANVLFEANGNHLTLTATDLEIGGVTHLDGIGKKKWAVAAPVKKLIQYLGKVDEEEVTLATTENHSLTVTHGTNSTKVSGMSRGSYPELPATPTDEPVTLRRLPIAIERTVFAISHEESRFTLHGALLEVDAEGGRLVATDGHRLSLAPVVASADTPVRAILPTKALREAEKLDGDCAFRCDKDHAFLDYDTRRIIARKLAGNFPDYHRVVPKDLPNHVLLPVASTKKALERVALYADECSRAVRFTVNEGSLGLLASSVETGEATATVATRPGQIETVLPFEIGLNAEYVLDFLNITNTSLVAFCFHSDIPDTVGEDGEVTKRGSKGGSNMVLFTTGDQWVYCVMPMRI